MSRPPRIALVGVLPLVLGLAILGGGVALFGADDGPERGPDGQLPPVSAEEGVTEGVEPDEASIVVVGDSVIEQSSEEIDAALSGPASVIGLPGYRTDELLPTVRDALAGVEPVDVVVVMGGHNDLWQQVERAAPIAELMDTMASSSACPVWILVPTKGAWDRTRAQAFDEQVRAAADAAGVAVEAAWRDVVDAGSGPTPDGELVAPDLVHPTPEGRARLAEVIAGAVARHCG